MQTFASYFLWSGSPDVFTIGSFVLRWYALLLVAAYLACRKLLAYLCKKEGLSVGEVNPLLTYLILASLVGARLGYVLFYEPELITTSPLEIFLPFEFEPDFHFAGMRGFSLHGAAVGILVTMWFRARKMRMEASFLLLGDLITMPAVLAGSLILSGSFLNSDVRGRPTDAPTGTVMIMPVTRGLLNVPCCIMRNPEGENPLKLVMARKDTARTDTLFAHRPVILYLFFRPGATEQLVNEFLIGDVKTYLYDMSALMYEPGSEPLHYTIFREADGTYEARVRTIAIARHPVQLIECIICLLLLATGWIWKRRKASLLPGIFFGWFGVTFWASHFLIGFLGENENQPGRYIPFSLGQILSIPFLLFAVAILVAVYTRKKAAQKV